MNATEASRRTKRDFPFYDGRPVALSLLRWLIALAFTAAGFGVLLEIHHIWPGDAGRWAGALLFVALPLVGLALAAGRAWTALFPRLTARDVLVGLAFVPLPALAAGLIAHPLMKAGLTSANPFAAILEKLPEAGRVSFLLRTLPQLIGEELVTIIPFLAILAVGVGSAKIPRGAAVAVAWVVSAVIFGALHLSTYDRHVVQAIGVIGVSRLMLTLPYLITKSVWSSAITHIVHDWTLFAFVLIASGQVVSS